jgi:hypothetical protein
VNYINTESADNGLSRSHRYEDRTVVVPYISGMLAEKVTGTFDVTKYEPSEKAAFVWGLCKLYETMKDIGEVEHTNDWDWYVQVELIDGKTVGDEYDPFTGEHRDYSTDDKDQVWYCDEISTPWEYAHIANDSAESYYNGLTVHLQLWNSQGCAGAFQYFRMDQIKTITISQR